MSTPLPSRPNLNHLRKEAKDTHKAHTSGDRAACVVLRGLRRFKEASDDTIMKENVTLQEIQLAIAIKYGYPNWAALRAATGAPAEPGFPKVSPEEQRSRTEHLERILADGQAARWTNEQLIEFFKAVIAVARGRGLVAIDNVPERLEDPFLKLGMRLAVDGNDAHTVRSILLERKRTLLAEHERRMDMITAAINGLVWAENPFVVEARCRAFLPTGEPPAGS